jgi:hypothetical protein
MQRLLHIRSTQRLRHALSCMGRPTRNLMLRLDQSRKSLTSIRIEVWWIRQPCLYLLSGFDAN